MQVNKVNGHCTNFGMKCPPKLKAQLWEAMPAREFFPLFKNGDKLAESIDKIGSDNTSLEKFKVTRHIGENFFDGATEIWDECRIVFRMLNPKGKKERVTAQIRSNLDGEALSDIHRDFVDVAKMAEEEFISGYLGKEAQKGNLKEAAKGLLELYPQHTPKICSEFKKPENIHIDRDMNEWRQKPFLIKFLSLFS